MAAILSRLQWVKTGPFRENHVNVEAADALVTQGAMMRAAAILHQHAHSARKESNYPRLLGVEILWKMQMYSFMLYSSSKLSTAVGYKHIDVSTLFLIWYTSWFQPVAHTVVAGLGPQSSFSWCRDDMDLLWALLALCKGNPTITGGFYKAL